MKQVWSNEYEYKRILKILKDYWLTEPNEECVVVNMYFRHKDGREQWKRISWFCPVEHTETEPAELPAFKWYTAAELAERCKTCLYESGHGCRTWECEYTNIDEYIKQRKEVMK